MGKSEEDLPWQIGEYNASNTLLLDDSPYKALGNPPNTAIFPHTYQYMDKKDNSLGPGGSLYMYLEGLAEADDVQTYVKENPFGQEPITDKNPKWDFYLEVIESLTRTPKCSVKSENVISKSDPTYYRRKAEGVESGNSGDSVGKKDNEGNWVNNENNKEQNSMWRGRKRGRSPNGSQSPTRGKVWYPRDRTTPWIGRERHNVSHSMSHERYESRSRSPSYRRGGEFNGERMRVYNKAPPVEVCRAFMQGRCYRGANCWYLHHQPDMNIINNNNRGVGGGVKQQNQNVPASSNNINVNGRNETSPCVRKIRDSDEDIVVKDERTEQVCKFTNQVPPPQKISDNEECRDFSRGKCHRGESCMHRHISYRDECRDFISGKCHRGSSCVHLHNETDEIDGTRYSWSRQHVQHPVIPPPPQISPIPRNVYSRPNTIPAERPRSCNVYSRPNSIPERSLPVPQIPIPAILKEEVKRAAPYQPKPCYHFRRGKCAYGDRCHFAHVEFDRPRPPYLTKENLPFTSKGGQTEKTQELDMEEKVEVSKTSTTQLCDEENPKPCVPPVTDDVRGEKETQGN